MYNTRMLSYGEARACVVEQTRKAARIGAALTRNVNDALGEVLAQEVRNDREYPPFDRSTRDGYAVRAAEAGAGAQLKCVGEIKAGDTVTQPLPPNTCIQI